MLSEKIKLILSYNNTRCYCWSLLTQNFSRRTQTSVLCGKALRVVDPSDHPGNLFTQHFGTIYYIVALRIKN